MILPVPRNEVRRLAELRSLALIEDAPDRALDRIVRLAVRHFAMPMAAVAFVDEYRVWFKTARGFSVRGLPRENSRCARVILQKGVLVIHDTELEGDSHPGPTGTELDEVRFYAGAPLRTADGCALGALCVLDSAPRVFTREDEETLADMAAMVMDELALRRKTVLLSEEKRFGGQSRRSLVRQDRLLQRLSASREGRVGSRLAELTRLNESLRAQLAGRAQADADLQSAKDEAEKANMAKSDFLVRMSHELRTPLNAILGFGQLLQGTLTPESQRDCAGHVVTAGRHLLSLINEVLDIARIEAGRLSLSPEPVVAAEIVSEALDLVRPLAAERRLALEVRAHPEPGCVALADRQRLKQVLLNLVSNAVKYSPEEGSVIVQWRPDGERALKFCVSDEGPGITREQAARLFVAFERLGAEHSNIPGTGLGLTLSKRLVEAMHGKIGVRANTGRGSTFWVRLPRWEEPGSLPRRARAVPADAPPLSLPPVA